MSNADPAASQQERREIPTSGPRPGAIIIGGDYQGLGIVRSLGRHGVPICVIDDERSIARFSRYTTYSVHVTSLRDERTTVDLLLEIGKKRNLKNWVLYATRDETVAALSRYRPELASFFTVPTPEWDSVKWLWNKANTYRLAQELEIPIPRTWYPHRVEDLDQIDAEFPLVIKPAIKEHFFYATRAKAWRANTRDELRRMFQQAVALAGGEDEILVQDMIPGEGEYQFSYCTFFKNGRSLGTMTAKRQRQHPHDFGRASTYVETTDLKYIEALSEKFLRKIGYYGLAEVEYKLDPRDGQLKLLDVNGRTWGYHSLGPRAGVDFPYMLYRDLMGESVEECRAQSGISWVRLATDLPLGFREILARRLSLRSYIHTLGKFDTEAVFAREDVLPSLVEFVLLPYLSIKRGF